MSNGSGGYDLDAPPELYRLELGGEWGLWDLSGFGRQYVQCYSFYHVLMAAEQGDEYSWRLLNWAMHAFPWKGGWSAVDFFDRIVGIVPRAHLPRLHRVQYSSPGFIEILIGIAAAAVTVKTVCGAYDKIHDSYRRTQRATKENKLRGIDVRKAELSLRERKLVVRLVEDLRNDLEMRRFDGLLRSMKVHPLAELKILLTLCRRIKSLSKLQDDDKIQY